MNYTPRFFLGQIRIYFVAPRRIKVFKNYSTGSNEKSAFIFIIFLNETNSFDFGGRDRKPLWWH